MPLVELRTAVIVIVALTAAVCDVRTKRIPNALTFGTALAACLYALATAGISGVGMAVAGWLVGAALFFPMFALGGLGAGDVKLMAGLAAWFGPADALWLAIFASMAGGVVGALVALNHGYLRQAFANLRLMLSHWRVSGLGAVPGLTLQDTQAPRLAFALPIMIGAVCTLWRR